MARAFDGSDQHLIRTASFYNGAYPFSVSCWFWLTASASNAGIINITDHDDGNTKFHLRIGGDDTLIARIDDGTDLHQMKSTPVTPGTGQWYYGGVSKASGAGLNVYLDGTEYSSAENPDAISSNVSANTIAADYFDSTVQNYFPGYVAEVAIWAAELTAAEHLILSQGYSPLLVRPQSLYTYSPLLGNLSPEIDKVSGFDWTLTNAPTKAEHPPVRYPLPLPPAGVATQTGANIDISQSNLGAWTRGVQIITP